MISIIVPIYNVEKYLRRCIDSILGQTYRDLEVILVDDGSPDGCGAICDAYAEKDARVTVIHQKNAGVSAARNAGLACARGEWIGFVDPDDFIVPNMYQEMLDAINVTGAELAVCGYNYVDEDGKVDQRRLYVNAENEILTQKQLMSRFSDMPPTVRLGVVNKLFHRDLLQKHELKFAEGLHSSEDVLFLTEYAMHVSKVIFVHKAHYMNTVRPGSATHGGLKIDSLADSFVIHDQMYETVIASYPELKKHSLAFLMDICLLKYNEATSRLSDLDSEERRIIMPRLKGMQRYIRKRARQALWDHEIYWKTRISYLLK